MRDNQQLQGWTFLNFITFILHYRIYGTLKQRDLPRRYSLKDVIEYIERISMLKIGEE
ncbi:MAG: hypothetical protein JRM72_03635 [Nitrososphaerota archaeon]|jgi:hypothetical protein|nr:hypothetical protein [Nitrososphaerota archaeon]MDG7041335.1 hypothetical protein [Nitrososphaerota archaeon]MDG7043465.1 hypothetical protein [Nitrososphaerota archaeon]